MANENESAVRKEDGTQRKVHYGAGKQPWDTIKDLGWGPAFAAANVIKYLRRTKDREHSLESARWYYARLCDMCRDDDNYPKDVRRLLVKELSDDEFELLAEPPK